MVNANLRTLCVVLARLLAYLWCPVWRYAEFKSGTLAILNYDTSLTFPLSVFTPILSIATGVNHFLALTGVFNHSSH